MSVPDRRELEFRHSSLIREVLLNFWKIHILHHAAAGPIYGHWMMEELRRHGYALSPGTLYPLLRRMERHGWLEPVEPSRKSVHSRKEYRLTRVGAEALAALRIQVAELSREVLSAPKQGGRSSRRLRG